MIHITSEGNLFTSFCNSVAGTASFHQLAVTALFQFLIQFHFQFFIQSVLFLLVNFKSFCKVVCCSLLSLQLCNNCVCNSGIETHQVD